ncbi:hypothetical protein [Rahnella sp. PAMC 25559]
MLKFVFLYDAFVPVDAIGRAIDIHPAVIWPGRYYDPERHQ